MTVVILSQIEEQEYISISQFDPPNFSSTNLLSLFSSITLLQVTPETQSIMSSLKQSTPILMTRWIHLNHLPGVARRPEGLPHQGMDSKKILGVSVFFPPTWSGLFWSRSPSFEFLHRKLASQDYLVMSPRLQDRIECLGSTLIGRFPFGR